MSKEESKKNEPFFSVSDNFSSAYFGKVPAGASGEKNPAEDGKLINNFIDLITNPDKRDLRSDALDVIRKSNSRQFLVDLIENDDYEKHRKELVMACWECGLDFSPYLISFTNLVVNCEYLIALEAITVIDEMYDLKDVEHIRSAIALLNSESLSSEKQALAAETIARLSNFLVQDN
jgi:hypothetical protein